MCHPPADPVVSRRSLTSPIRGSRRGKCLRSHGSATKVGTTRVPAGHRPSPQALPSAWQSLTSPKVRSGEPNWRGQVTEHESGGLRLAGGEQLPSENPWYWLATLYGEPTRADKELQAKNRIARNRLMVAKVGDVAYLRDHQTVPGDKIGRAHV